MSILITNPGFRVLDDNGNPVSGAKLKFFVAGLTTPLVVYADSAGSTALGSVVYTDAGGYPVTTNGGVVRTPIYTTATSYKIQITDTNDVEIVTHDNLTGGAVGGGASSTEFAKSISPVVAETSTRAITSDDYGKVIQADPTAGSITLTLPEASVAGDGTRLTVRHNGTSGSISIASTSGQDIVGPQGTNDTYTIAAAGEEVILVCTGAGWVASAFYVREGSITTDKLSSAISGSFMQAGSIIYWPTAAATPTGYYDCDGAEKNRTTDAELYSVIGTEFGNGDGSTTFNLPNMAGGFVRVFDNGAGVDVDAASRTDRGDGTTGDAVGTWQAAGIGSHTHGVTTTGTAASAGAHTHTSGTLVTASAGDHNHSYDKTNVASGSTITTVTGGAATLRNQSANTETTGAHTHNITGSTASGGSHTHSVSSTGTAAAQAGATSDTRPINISMRALIFGGQAVASGASAALATILHGDGTPNDELGSNGDFYIDTSTTFLWGPKAADAWPASGIPLKVRWAGGWALTTEYLSQDTVKGGNGSTYVCILEHTATADDEPGVGANTATYWQLMTEKGDAGATGPSLGQEYVFDAASTADSDPGTGKFRLNHATPASATFLYINKTDRNLGDLSAIIGAWAGSTTTGNKAQVKIVDPDNTSEQMDLVITGALTDATTYYKVPIGSVVFNGAGSNIADATICSLGVRRTGDAGGGIANAYASVTDGTTTATASGSETFKFRGGTGITVAVASNDATHGDSVLITANVLDEDDMSSNSATQAPSQQSVKAYVDNVKVNDGDIIITLDASPPTGFVELDGATISGGAATYPGVAARYAWMVSSGNLVLPDFRGRVPRGFDNGAGTDPDAAGRTARAGDAQTGDYPGTYQEDEFEAHTHTYLNRNSNPNGSQGASGTHARIVTATTATGTAGGSTETRGKNIAVMYCMKMG